MAGVALVDRVIETGRVPDSGSSERGSGRSAEPPAAGAPPPAGFQGRVRAPFAELPDRRARRAGERAALRGAGRVLQDRARPTAQVQRVSGRDGVEDAGPGRRGDARADVRAGRRRRRDDAPRPRLRLGVADGLAVGALPGFADPRGLQLTAATRVHRVAPPAERACPHGGRQRARARRALRPDPVRRDARAHAQLRGAVRASRVLARAERALLLSRLLARPLRLPLRRRLDRAPLLHRRDDAVPTTCCRDSTAISRSRDTGASRDCTMPALQRHGSSGWTPAGSLSNGSSVAAKPRTGASSSSRAPSSGDTGAERSGSSRTTASRSGRSAPSPVAGAGRGCSSVACIPGTRGRRRTSRPRCARAAGSHSRRAGAA